MYGATHRTGSHVAIKILHASSDEEMSARFSAEAWIGNQLDHPGVVRVLDDGVTEDGSPYLVMDLLEGETLARRIARGGPLSMLEAARVLDAVLDVLEAAHARGVVHRDVKPDNVFLTREGGVKLLDFGIARASAVRGTSSRKRTIAGLVLGTLEFMAPEQANGRTDLIDARCDLWSAGATLFVALTERTIRSGETAAEQLAAALRRTPPMMTLAPELPAPMRSFLDRALAYDLAARFPSATEMRSALAVSIRDALSPAASAAGSRPAWRRPLPLGLALTACVCMAVGASVAVSRASSDPTPRPSGGAFLPPVPEAASHPAAVVVPAVPSEPRATSVLELPRAPSPQSVPAAGSGEDRKLPAAPRAKPGRPDKAGADPMADRF